LYGLSRCGPAKRNRFRLVPALPRSRPINARTIKPWRISSRPTDQLDLSHPGQTAPPKRQAPSAKRQTLNANNIGCQKNLFWKYFQLSN
jgi:hypothetical protein